MEVPPIGGVRIPACPKCLRLVHVHVRPSCLALWSRVLWGNRWQPEAMAERKNNSYKADSTKPESGVIPTCRMWNPFELFWFTFRNRSFFVFFCHSTHFTGTSIHNRDHRVPETLLSSVPSRFSSTLYVQSAVNHYSHPWIKLGRVIFGPARCPPREAVTFTRPDALQSF